MRNREAKQLIEGIIYHTSLDDKAPAYAREAVQVAQSAIKTAPRIEDFRYLSISFVASLSRYKSNLTVNKLKWELNKLLS